MLAIQKQTTKEQLANLCRSVQRASPLVLPFALLNPIVAFRMYGYRLLLSRPYTIRFETHIGSSVLFQPNHLNLPQRKKTLDSGGRLS